MGVILDSSVLIAAERKGHSVLPILEQVKALHGEIEIGLSVVSVAELTHGAYRTKEEPRKLRRLAFIDRLCLDFPVYPITIEMARMMDASKDSRQPLALHSPLRI